MVCPYHLYFGKNSLAIQLAVEILEMGNGIPIRLGDVI
jgi:hypothetical protein